MVFSKYTMFLKVIELGSMSKAAAECNYSQSAVSQIISSLEKELQLTLLNRSQTGIWLTSDGKYMLPYIEALSNAEQNIYKQASKLKGVESGRIVLGTFSSVSCHILMPIIKAFKDAYPNINIEIREGDNLAIESWLAKGSIDFGFIDSPTLPGFETIHVCRDPFVAVMSEEGVYANRDDIPVEIFEETPMIIVDEGSPKEAGGILRQINITPNVVHSSKDNSLILSMIENRLCLGYMGKLVLTKTPYKIISKPTVPQFYRDIVLTIKDRNAASVATQKFLEFFEENLESVLAEIGYADTKSKEEDEN